ncbi:MAG: hemerythrin domain-containing protein [Antricoccus sp.]
MANTSLSEALIREHRDIDSGIEVFIADLERGVVDAEPLLVTLAALRRHIYLEEQFVFPPLRQTGLMMPVMVMLREHGELWQLMDTLTELLRGSDPTVLNDKFVSTCRTLLAQLDQHNSKEEPIIYPHADNDLSQETMAELAEFLDSGSTPDGWVCKAAQ